MALTSGFGKISALARINSCAHLVLTSSLTRIKQIPQLSICRVLCASISLNETGRPIVGERASASAFTHRGISLTSIERNSTPARLCSKTINVTKTSRIFATTFHHFRAFRDFPLYKATIWTMPLISQQTSPTMVVAIILFTQVSEAKSTAYGNAIKN